MRSRGAPIEFLIFCWQLPDQDARVALGHAHRLGIRLRSCFRVRLEQRCALGADCPGSYPIKTRVSLSGTLIVARDIAHAKMQERLDTEGCLPEYMSSHVPGGGRRGQPRPMQNVGMCLVFPAVVN